jgi:hypothetical protein
VPYAFIPDGEHAFVSDAVARSVVRFSSECSAPVSIGSFEKGERVYLLGSDLFVSATDGVHRLPKTGGARVQVTPTPLAQLVADATHVYGFHDREIASVPRSGGTLTTLFDLDSVGADDNLGLVHAGDSLYVMARTFLTENATLYRVPLPDGEASVVFESTGVPFPDTPIARGDRVYFRADHDDSGEGILYEVAGGTASPVAGSTRVGAIVTVDETHFYLWRSDGSIVRTTRSGGALEPYLDVPDLYQAQFSETHVFWTVENWPDSAEIWSRPK